MPKRDNASHQIQRIISEFCEVRIAPIASKRVLENIPPYLMSLIIYRKSPPILNGRIDWMTTGQACEIEDEMTSELKSSYAHSKAPLSAAALLDGTHHNPSIVNAFSIAAPEAVLSKMHQPSGARSSENDLICSSV